MKEINEMTQQELIDFFVQKKQNGRSYRELDIILEKNQINSATRSLIMEKLKQIDQEQEVYWAKKNRINTRNRAIWLLLMSVFIAFVGFILLMKSAEAGVVFIFNLVIFIVAATLFFKGILGLISVYKN